MLFTKFGKTVLTTVAAAAFLASPIAFADTAEDTAITAEVKAKLAEEKDMPKDISVLTKDRVVVLVGSLETKLQAERAIEVASGINKVEDVKDDQLKVKGSKSYGDAYTDSVITAKIKGKIAALLIAGQIQGYDLNVTTANGVVHLDGTVGAEGDIAKITNMIEGKDGAKAAAGVKSVKTNVTVKVK